MCECVPINVCEPVSTVYVCLWVGHLALPTLGAGHDQAGVGQVALAVLGAVHVGAPALLLAAARADGGVDGHGVGALGLLGRAVTLDLTALGVAGVGEQGGGGGESVLQMEDGGRSGGAGVINQPG